MRETNEETLAAALRPFGWTCTEEFWRRYYTDAWVFNLANAVERLHHELQRSQEKLETLGAMAPDMHPDLIAGRLMEIGASIDVDRVYD